LLLSGVLAAAGAVAQPLTGQLIVDPVSAAWLRYQDGGSFFLCAPGNPESFLYRGGQNPDGTRAGDQQALLDILAPTRANGLYLMAVRSHGGDGDGTHNPFVGNDPALGLSTAVLDQWEGWFDQMDAAGIVIFFIFYDDSARIWGSRGGGIQPEETPFITSLVDRFEHHLHLIWVVAEEYEEAWTQAEASQLAAIVRAADDHDHPIAVHQLGGLEFDFPADPVVDQFAIQLTNPDADGVHDDIVGAWNDADGLYNLNLAEPHGWGTGATARQNSWAVATAGAYVMHLEWDIASTPVDRLRECGYLRDFFEAADLFSMAPADSLALGSTDYVLANEGEQYFATARGPGDLGLADLPPGRPQERWLDVVTGTVIESIAQIPGGSAFFTRPTGIGQEVALYLDYAAGELFADGFESGDTNAWSSSVP
jgi:hypothetical protein